MPAINFKREFVSAIQSGEKKQTIRRVRMLGNPRVGEMLTLYTGMRSSKCELIKKVKCTVITPIAIFWDGCVVRNGKKLYQEEVEALARNDGFESAEDFIAFFKKTYSKGGFWMKAEIDGPIGFEGNIIEWE